MNVNTILSILQMAGTDTPAFIALYREVVPMLSKTDQAKLQAAYADARAKSDQDHRDAQD